MNQPPEDQGTQPVPPLRPFTPPGPPEAPPAPPGYGQPAQGYGQPPGYGQPYGGYQPYPGAPPGMAAAGRDPALAEWWQRLLARLVDGVVIFILMSPLWVAALLPVWHRLQALASEAPYLGSQQAYNAAVNQAISGMFGRFLLIGITTAVLKFGYDWLQHGLWGQTLGKRALGTKVVMAGTRSPISGGAACGRAAVYALVGGIPSLGFFWWVIDCLWLLWDPQRQCLHDKAGRTVVVKKDMLPVSRA